METQKVHENVVDRISLTSPGIPPTNHLTNSLFWLEQYYVIHQAEVRSKECKFSGTDCDYIISLGRAFACIEGRRITKEIIIHQKPVTFINIVSRLAEIRRLSVNSCSAGVLEVSESSVANDSVTGSRFLPCEEGSMSITANASQSA